MHTKTSELTGAALDWAVAKCDGIDVWAGKTEARTRYTATEFPEAVFLCDDGEEYSPSTDWSRGGPIIDRECMEFDFECNDSFGRYIDCSRSDVYRAKCQPEDAMMPTCAKGPTHLIAAMRCFVASKLGDEVDVPDGLG